jgi:hypothetical protein
MSTVYVPPVPTTKLSADEERDFIIKEYLQKLKDKVDSLDAQVQVLNALHGIS